MKYVHVGESPFHRSFMSGMMYPNNLIPLRGIRYFLGKVLLHTISEERSRHSLLTTWSCLRLPGKVDTCTCRLLEVHTYCRCIPEVRYDM